MEPIFVTGHRNPDTDSIVAAIAYASLRNALGDRAYTAARIGQISDQTQLVLDKFGFQPPLLLRNVRTQVRDLSYDTPPVLSCAVTIHHAWELLQNDMRHIESMPVATEDGKLFGVLTTADIAAYEMRFVADPVISGIPLFNLLSSLDGQLFSDEAQVSELSGELVIALPCEGGRAIEKGSIVICGDQPDVITAAIAAQASCLVLCESSIDRGLIDNAGSTCVIGTPYDAYRAARLIIQSVPVSRICQQENLVAFHLDDYLDDVRETTLRTRYRSYPILDENDRVIGTLSRFHLLRPNRKRVVLVDHNETAQSVAGLEQAEIMEIIDHHRLADVQTASPVYMRNEPVGSTCTIITSMFQERGVMPSPKLAGLLAAGIVADTILFQSPTSTDKDRVLAERMARVAGISLETLGKEIFSVSAPGDHDPEELLFSDFKKFQIAGHFLGIGQITCLDSLNLSDRRAAFLEVMEREQQEKGYDTLLLMLTDVLRGGTELLAVGDIETVEQAFNVKVVDHGAFLPGVISRKKQVVPALSLLWG